MLMTDRPDDIVRPTKERLRKSIGWREMVEVAPGGTTRKSGALREIRPLDDLRDKELITPEQYAAGYRYWVDHELSGYSPRVTLDYRRMLGSLDHSRPDLDAAERREFHRKRWKKANDLLESIACRKPMHWLLIEGIKPENIGKKHWGYRGQRAASASAVTSIRIALFLLAKFYGLIR